MAIPKSGPIKMTDIVASFRPNSNVAPHSISEYYRNGENVTDIYDNRNIPESGPIKFSDFYGSGLQSEYNWPIPELCTDDFISFAKGIESWDQVNDSKTEYIGRNDTEASMEIPVYNKEGATITIPALKFEIDTERGNDLKYERILKNTSVEATNKGLPTDTFSPGSWNMIIPKKFKRIRIVAVSGGGSGSVQKISLTGLDMENKKTKGTVEDGYDGGDSSVSHDNFKVSVKGGHGGNQNIDSAISRYDQTLSTAANPIVTGGTSTLYDNKSAETPTEYIAIDHHMYDADVPVFDDGSKSFARNNFPINILYAPPLPHARRFLGNDHPSNRGFGEDSLFGPGGQPGSEYSSSSTPQTGPVEVLDTSFGAGGAAGQHGGRGSDETGYTATQAGQSGITGYFGDFEVKGGDSLNIRVGSGGSKSKNTYNDYDDILGRETQRISESGYGGDGMVQIIGGHGFAHSSLSHPGWVLEDEDGGIIASSYAASESSEGVTLFQGSTSSQRTLSVMGPNNVSNPRIYRLRFSARIGKSGDESVKTRFCHIGKKSIQVQPLKTTVMENPPNQELYDNPDLSPDVEQVSGTYLPRGTDDNEIIDNWFVPQCNISLTVTSNSGYESIVTFTKSPQGAVSQERGGGPDSFVLQRNYPVVEFTMAKQEKYVLEKSGLFSTAAVVSDRNRIATYLRSRQEFQLDEENEASNPPNGINTWETADMAVFHSGAGGFFLGLDGPVSEPPIDVSQIEYDMIGGGRGGNGQGYTPGGEAEDGYIQGYLGSAGVVGGATILSKNGVVIADTGVYNNNTQMAPLNWNNTIYGNGGLSQSFSWREQGGMPRRPRPLGWTQSTPNAPNGIVKTGTLDVKAGDVLDFVIGQGGAGGAGASWPATRSVGNGDEIENYTAVGQSGEDGQSGAIILQGVTYTESGSHTVTDELQFERAVLDGQLNPLVFGTTGHPIDGAITWPYPWWRDWTISGGRIKELFGEDPIRLGEDYMRTVMWDNLGSYITKEQHGSIYTTTPDPYDPDGNAPYVGNFPELYEKYYWSYQSGADDDETNVRSNWRLKSNWKEIAQNSDRLNSPPQDLKTFFSCGYRGDNTIGPGTNIPHNYTPPPPPVITPVVPKKDKIWDVNIKWFCFLGGTMVTMEDGSKKAIETIDIGEKVKIGGAVFACAKFICNNLHDYHGIKVSGSHMVLENDKWIRVEESKDSTLISNENVTVYNFGTENRRLEIEGITFTDYFEIDEKVKLERLGNMYFDHWEDYMDVRNEEVAKIINEKE